MDDKTRQNIYNIVRYFFDTYGVKTMDDIVVDIRTDIAYEQIKEYQDKLDEPLRCKCGLVGCVYEPLYIKTHYPEWYKQLGCPTTCKSCEDGDEYDDEDK